MKFVVTIECDNASFEGDDLAQETGNILEQLSKKVKDGYTHCYLNDYNGNRVGYAEFVKDNEEQKKN